MYDIRQFRPALYALLMLGISGFAVAAQWPGLWVLATGGLLLNAWLVKTGRFTPMPRILASIVTIIAFLYIADLVIHSSTTPILIIGQFLVLLQLVKLFEQRANRDFAQLIVLSLLLMVAAAINTASLIFGLMFISYLFLSLYVCLLFHLKVESEDARKAIALPETEPNPSTLRQDQRFLSSSMRRLTALISMTSVTAAVLVFLFFPRGTGANLLGPQFGPGRSMTGFSEQVGFEQVAKITQNTDKVAEVKVWLDNEMVRGTQPIYLRGLTLNYYTGPGQPYIPTAGGRPGRPPYHWIRTLPQGRDNEIPRDGDGVALNDNPVTSPLWKQNIRLQPTGSNVLFAMGGPVRIGSKHRLAYSYSIMDDYLAAKDAGGPVEYEITSTERMPYHAPERLFERTPDYEERIARYRAQGRPRSDYPPFRRSVIDPQIAEYVQKPEVSGRGAGDVPLIELREKYLATERARLTDEAKKTGQEYDEIIAPITPYDEAIALNIEKHLRTTFSYTLDLTDTQRPKDQDPMVAFLYNYKRGHCEYFAGAMTLMLQSLQIPARVVIGFRCDDYNNVGEYYRVDQSQAHAWVEARGGFDPKDPATANGAWLRYDPTSGREENTHQVVTFWGRVRNVFDFLEHTWATSVIAYDRGARDSLVKTMDERITRAAVAGTQFDLPGFLKTENWAISIGLITILMTLAIIALVGSIGWFAWERWRMRKRAARIGIESLPSEERLKLARQLGFYDDLLRLLERRGIIRPPQFTPMEFTDSLSFLPADAYHSVRRLTEVFYRVRYGRQKLSTGQRSRLQGIIDRVEQILGPPAMT